MDDSTQRAWRTEKAAPKKLPEPERRILCEPQQEEAKQTVRLTKSIIRMLLRGRSEPCARQLSILGMQNSVSIKWEQELDGKEVSVETLLELHAHSRGPELPQQKTGRSHSKVMNKTEGAGSGATYRSRDENLRAIGFRSYDDYLDSRLWQWIRQRVFAKKGSHCTKCGKDATQVHHSRYSVNALTGATLGNMWPICVDCHKEIEFDKNGRKRSLHEANVALGVENRRGKKNRRDRKGREKRR